MGIRGEGEEDILPGSSVAPDEKSGDRHPVISRARARVNRPPPATKSFGTGEPGFVKVPGRSPGAPAPLADSGRRRGIGDLPQVELGELQKLLQKRETRFAALRRRVRQVPTLTWVIALLVSSGIAFVVYVALHR